MNFRPLNWVSALAAATIISVPSGSLSAASVSPEPRQVVESFHGALLGAMKDAKKLGYQGRYKLLSPAVAKAFHLPFMTAVVAGHHWRKFSDAQKRTLFEAFSRMTKGTYAHRFDGYGGERFEIVSAAPARRNTVLVKTRLVKTDGEAVALDYRMMYRNKRWGIVDVYLTGKFSEVATKRSEYSAVIKRQGLPSLIKHIDRVLRDFESEKR